MSKELEAKVESITLKKPTLQKLYIADDNTIETIVIKGKEYKCTDIIKQDEVLRIIKEYDLKPSEIMEYFTYDGFMKNCYLAYEETIKEFFEKGEKAPSKAEFDLLKEVLL